MTVRRSIAQTRRMLERGALLVALAACSTRVDLGSRDAGARDASFDASFDGGLDGGFDAFVLRDAGPAVDRLPLVWNGRTCQRAAVEGRTGDECVFPTSNRCFGADRPGAFATCDPAGRLVTGEIEGLVCSAPRAEPWADCELALAGGRTGEPCTGDWACAANVPELPCCVDVAGCGFLHTDFSSAEGLSRTRVCLRDCAIPITPDRPVWTDCPTTRGPTDPEPLYGDPCAGEWACAASHTAFSMDSGEMPIPVWCAEGQLRLSIAFGYRGDFVSCGGAP
jgi:hypothetical protein